MRGGHKIVIILRDQTFHPIKEVITFHPVHPINNFNGKVNSTRKEMIRKFSAIRVN